MRSYHNETALFDKLILMILIVMILIVMILMILMRILEVALVSLMPKMKLNCGRLTLEYARL